MNRIIGTVVLLALSLVFVKNALHMFQQNRYELYRYTKWLFNRKNIRFSPVIPFALIMIVAGFLFKKLSFVIVLLIVAGAAFFIDRERKKEYIKNLVYTARVKRQCAVMAVLMILSAILVQLILPLNISAIVIIYLPYFLIFVLYVLTEPVERAIKKSYENKARRILDSMSGMIKIGITGSFGKTTTKNIVTDIVGDSFYTLMTPASYNTPMGITRTVREYMKPIHEVFVCEMGADHVGEITYLMDFVKPKYGIVTSIGPQHLNTFRSMDNIIREKMQMIEKLPKDGTGIINIDNEFIRNYRISNTCKIVTVGIKNTEADLVAKDISYSKSGSAFTVNINGQDYRFQTVLLGEHNIMNLLGSIAVALELGITPEKIVESVKRAKRVEHRLELKKMNGLTFIDNAFNSNPVGSKLSLDVLKMMDGRRVIVTPGLIDLGSEEDHYNYEFGLYMKDRADYVLLVGEKQTEFIYKGLKESGFDMENVLVFRTVREAFAYLYMNFGGDDTILLENDLPDAFSY